MSVYCSGTYLNNGAHDMYAHYFKSGKDHEMTISKTTKPVGWTTYFPTRREAVQHAKKLKAQPWNY